VTIFLCHYALGLLGHKSVLYLFRLLDFSLFFFKIHAGVYEGLNNITFLVHDINVVHKNQRQHIMELP
jgi:hypothetical protein